MIRLQTVVWIGVFFLVSSASAFAHPEFFEAYKKDPYLRVIPADCSTCHMSKTGGDDRNAFGQAFEGQGTTITPLLRAQFPDRFAYPVSKVSDTLSVYFSDPNNKVVVLDSGGKLSVVDVDKKSVDGKPAVMSGSVATAGPTAGNGSPAAAANPVSAKANSEIPADVYAREGVFFGAFVVDLPTPKPIQKGGVDFIVQHRFVEKLFQVDAGQTC